MTFTDRELRKVVSIIDSCITIEQVDIYQNFLNKVVGKDTLYSRLTEWCNIRRRQLCQNLEN